MINKKVYKKLSRFYTAGFDNLMKLVVLDSMRENKGYFGLPLRSFTVEFCTLRTIKKEGFFLDMFIIIIITH